MSVTRPRDERKRRDAILRRVYETNVELNEPGLPPPRRKLRPNRRLRSRTVALMLVAVVAAAPLYMRFADELQTPGLAPGAAEAVASVPAIPSAPVRESPPDVAMEPAVAAAASSELQDLAQATVRELFGLSVRTIVIDAGHGGRDPGTVGRSGTLEKDITLDVARSLKEKLQDNPQYRIFLVRDSDAFVTLRERAGFANAQDADLFVSIHVNYLANTSKNAIETYYFGEYQDLHARTIAHRENQYSSYTISEFEKLANDMQNTMKLQESEALAKSIQASLLSNLRQQNHLVLDTGVRAAPFMVLLGVKAPSVLVEIGNLSSPDAEENLQNERYRDKMATYLASGIAAYLNYEPNDGNPNHVKGKNGIAQR